MGRLNNCRAIFLLSIIIDAALCFTPTPTQTKVHLAVHFLQTQSQDNDVPPIESQSSTLTRKQIIQASSKFLTTLLATAITPLPSHAKCTNLESCREEGERKIEIDLKSNPIIKLSNGVRYRVLQPSTGSAKVQEGSVVDFIYSISTASGQYMYSKGFGYEKVQFGNKFQSDLGLDSMRVTLGKHEVPVGIEMTLLGMGRGERRRVELPPGSEVGFESSNWSPEPTTRRGKVQMEQYKRKLEGFGSQPPFPAETVWDVEVLGIRN